MPALSGLTHGTSPETCLNAANNSGVQGSYAYDGLGRKVEAKEGTSTIFYGYLGTETLAEGAISPYTDYIHADSLRVARVTGASGQNPTIVFYHTDALGSTRLVTDAARNVLFSDNYKPYGQDSQSTGSETYKFTGKPVSQTTSLYYYYQRSCDPSTGRFILSDPSSSLVRKLLGGAKKIARMVTNPVDSPVDDRSPPSACHR